MLSTLLRVGRPAAVAKPAKGRTVPAPSVPEGAAPSIAQLGQIAQATVQLAALGPQLARLAAEMETQAQAQARRAERMAATMGGLAGALETAVTELRSSSAQMHRALETVEHIAAHTRLLSINASIEAARAGVEGRAFAVIVDEVKQLADRTGQTTLVIGERMQDFETNLARMNAVTSAQPPPAAAQETLTVGMVNREVRGMADSAGVQLGNAESVHSLGDQINRLTELLLLAVGKFRFDAHARAQASVEGLVSGLLTNRGDRAGLERALEDWLEAQPHFELAYLTDGEGRQIVANIGRGEGRIVRDEGGFGRDWSERPWYRAALGQAGICSTDVYRSTATGDFCFTVAVALRDRQGGLLGVFGSDVNFQRLVGQ